MKLFAITDVRIGWKADISIYARPTRRITAA